MSHSALYAYFVGFWVFFYNFYFNVFWGGGQGVACLKFSKIMYM